jgi:hypothetical protein
MKPKTLAWVVGLVGITVLILAACGSAATPTPTTAPPTQAPPTNTSVPPPTNTPVPPPTNTPVPPTPTAIPRADSCVACHTNSETLQKLAVGKEKGSAETEGEG